MTGITNALLIPHRGAAFFTAETDILFAVYYAAVFGVSLLSGVVLRSLTLSLLGFFSAYMLCLLLTGLALDLPGLAGLLPETVTEQTALVLTFTALFPTALLVGLVGALLGAASSE